MILGAGASSRMGQPKLLLPWGATSVLGHQISTWQVLGAGPQFQISELRQLLARRVDLLDIRLNGSCAPKKSAQKPTHHIWKKETVAARTSVVVRLITGLSMTRESTNSNYFVQISFAADER